MTTTGGGEIVFIDSGIENLDEVIAGVREGVEVVVLDPSRDALTQMADALAGRSGLTGGSNVPECSL